MERSWQSNNNGGQPPGCGDQPPPSSSGPKVRTPTVHDALPYTPLSSIVPFNSDIIRSPMANPTVQPTAFSNYPAVQSARGVLQQLSAGATNAETASKRYQQSIQDVRRLLDPESLTQYHFKKPNLPKATRAPPETASKQRLTLHSFAKMVLKDSAVPFQYLTPEQSPEAQTKRQKEAPQYTAETSLATPQSFVKPDSVSQNGPPTSQIAGPPSSLQNRQVSAVMPNALSQAQRAQYQYMPEQESVSGALNLTSSKVPASSNASRIAKHSKREEGDAALESLRNLLDEIFQAEDQIQPDTSGHVAAYATTIFEIRDTENGTQPVLRPDSQSKLESAISKVVKHGRLSEVETETLIHAQRLCEVSVAGVDSLAFSIGDDWSDQDTEEWLQRIALAENGLSATRTLTKILSGGAHLKELQSEDYLSGVLNAVRAVVERCIIPIVEESAVLGEKIRGSKSGPPQNPKFAVAFNNRQTLQVLLNGATRATRYLGELLVRTDFDGSTISSVEYLCKSIIFAENATVERDSALSIAKFESLRHCTMDVYARIFTKYTDQRQFILDEIITSLEKLPATKQSARQYRPKDTKPIQLVSALLMRLIQTSATRSKNSLKEGSKADDGEDDDVSDEDAEGESDSEGEGIKVGRKKQDAGPGNLAAIVKPLHDAASFNATFVVDALIKRAVTTSKSSDEPYRKLLDIFTEDFLNVLGSSDWPAAEMLLLTLVSRMIGLVESPKSSGPARTLSLELLGVIGSGVIDVQMQARRASQAIDASTDTAKHLQDLLGQSESNSLDVKDLVALDGPYRIWAEYLNDKSAGEDALLQSAHGYLLMQWAFTAIGGREGSVESDTGDAPGSSRNVQNKLREMLLDPKWLDDRSTLRIGTSEGCFAVLVATMNSKLCRAFQRIFNLLISSMGSEQPTVRSRSIKSIVTLLEKDPTMLDRDFAIINRIFRSAQDQSSMVRDSALGLLQKCISMRPALDAKVCSRVIDRTKDATVGVRKRAMKMLKEIYLRDGGSQSMRPAIADAIISRIEDIEESVAELARTTIEEIWFQAFYGLSLDGDNATKAKLAFRAQAALLIATVDRDDSVMKVLEALVKRLSINSKTASANLEVCRTLVVVLFDGIIDSDDIPGSPNQSAVLRSLTVFARASPRLFTAPQLERLEPYTQNLTKTDELEIFRSVLIISRNAMPHLTTMKTNFLQTMQSTLIKSSTRLQKTELREVAPCLWTINKILGNVERLVNFMISVLQNIHNMRNEDLSNDQVKASKVSRLIVIASEFGNACDFDPQLASFKAEGKCGWYKGNSVAGLIVDTICGYANPKQTLIVRRTAIDGMCTVAQAWPKQFLGTNVISALETVFRERIPELEIVLLSGLEGFFVAQEIPEENADVPVTAAGIASGSERLGRTYVASDLDGASTSLAQRFLSDVLRIALSSCSEPAFIAARLVVSVNKQGLVHPKESGPALVALETCPNKTVASEAFKEHKAQHQKHESLFEKEYMRAVQQVFDYQTKIIGDPLGYVGQPPSAKMHLTYEVLKAGKAQVRKKFMTNLSQKLNFDPIKLDTRAAVPVHLAFVRFCCENLALFDYDKVEDLLHLLTCLEKTFSSTGVSVAQGIESEVLKMHVDNMLGSEGLINGTSDTIMTSSSAVEVDPARLRQLSVAAQTLSIIWETRSYLRRVWNMQKYIAKAKGKDKDANKTPNRATNTQALGDAYLKRIAEIMASASSEQDQRATCAAFVELISVDTEVKVGGEDDENMDLEGLFEGGGYDSPSESSGRKSPSVGVGASGGGRGRKRKGSTGAAGATPKKRGRVSGKGRKSVSFNNREDEDGEWA